MDGILHSQCLLAELEIGKPVAYCIYNTENRLVGFCIIGQTSYSFADIGIQDFLPTVEIACLAVHQTYQHQKVGTAILDKIREKINEYMPEAIFMHVDALDLNDETYSAVPFYEKYGFDYYTRSGSDTASMFYQLMEIDKE